MPSNEQYEELEQKHYSLTVKDFVAIMLLLGECKSEIKDAIVLFYQRYGKDGVVTYQAARKWVSDEDHRKRLTALLILIGSIYSSYFDEYHNTFDTHLRSIIQREIDFFDVKVVVDDVLNTRWGMDDTTWDQRLSKYNSKWNTVTATDLKQSLLRQDNLDKVLNDLNKRFVSMEKILWNLFLTETTAVGSLARRDVFKTLGVKKYRFYARADERTCDICGSLHGLVFPISAYEVGVTASPIHSHCRCWEVPITE